MYNVQCTLYIVHCTMYSVQCVLVYPSREDWCIGSRPPKSEDIGDLDWAGTIGGALANRLHNNGTRTSAFWVKVCF